MDMNLFNTPTEGGGTPSAMFMDALNAGDAPAAVGASEPMPEPAAAEGTPLGVDVMPEASAAEPEPAAPVNPEYAPQQTEPAPYEPAPETVEKAVENSMNNVTVPAQAGIVEEPEEEVPDFSSEAFMDEFYDNPAGAVEKAANAIANKKINEIKKDLKPLLEQSRATQQRNQARQVIGDFLNNNADASEYFEDMSKYIQDNQLNPMDPRTYSDAYRVSKLGRQGERIKELEAAQAQGNRTLDDYLNDEQSLAAILNNDTVKGKVIEQYLKSLADGAKPTTIGQAGAGQPSATPINRATTMSEAKKRFVDALNQ